MNKTFTAYYRYRQEGLIGPQNYFVDIVAPSMKEARRIAKSYEGREERMQWFMDIERKENANG